MCTVFYLAEFGLLSKNRDKENPETEEIVADGDILAIRTRGADYFSLGINRHGCAFVSTAVNNPDWTRAVEAGRGEDARTLWQRDTAGLVGPTRLVSELLPSVRRKEEWLDAIARAGVRWRGYNVVLADADGASLLETHGDQTALRPLAARDAVANHFTALPFGPKSPEDYPSSFARLAYAREKVAAIGCLEDLLAAIHPSVPADRERIWRKGAFSTVSSTVLDLASGRLLHASGIEAPYQIHRLPQPA